MAFADMLFYQVSYSWPVGLLLNVVVGVHVVQKERCAHAERTIGYE